MKRSIINSLLVIVAIAAFAWCVTAKGLQWFIGFVPLVWAVITLLKLNTNYIKEY